MECREHAGCTVIFRAYITRSDGTVVYARDHGLRGFPIHVST